MSKRTLWIVGALACAGVTALVFAFVQGHRAEQDRLIDQLETQSQRQLLTTLLVKELGFNGVVHQFKDYVVGGEERHYAAARHAIERAGRALLESRSMNNAPHLEREYQRIADMLSGYQSRLERVRQLRSEGVAVELIEQDVWADDTQAGAAQRAIISFLQAGLQRSVVQMQDYNRRTQRYLFGAMLAAALATTVLGLLLLYYLRFARNSENIINEISTRQRLLDAAPNPILVVAENGEILFANDGAAALFDVAKQELMHSHLEEWIPAPAKFQHERLRQLFFSSKGARTMLNPVQLHTRSGQTRDVEVCIGLFQMDAAYYAVANILDVTKITSYRNRLDQAERKYRSTFEMAPVGIVHLDLQSRFVEVNPYFARMLGYGTNELNGKTITDVTHPDDVACNQNLFDRLQGNGVDVYRAECRYLRSDNRIVWGDLVVTLSCDELGAPQHLVVVVDDITQRKQFEQHLLASENKFKTIAHYVNGVVWMASPGATRILFVNEAYERIWQRSRESLYKQPRSFIDAVVEDDRARVEKELQRHAQGTWNIRYRIERSDGVIRHIQDEGTAVRDDNGEILYLVGLARDVTDEQLFRERLESTNQQLEQLAKFDPLTMALRRQFCAPDLNECIALFRRYQTDATLVLIDLDDFKRLNDRYGHETGDDVLLEFSRLIRSFIRETDSFYRFSGDEFLVLLRATSFEDAQKVVEKIYQRVQPVRAGMGQEVSVRFSCGLVALGSQTCETADDWIRLADERVVASKRWRKSAAGDVN